MDSCSNYLTINNIMKSVLLCVFTSILFLTSCNKGADSLSQVKKSSDKSLVSFGFLKADNPKLTADYAGIINGCNISLSVPSNTDVSALKATFTSSPKSTVKIGEILQQDKLTANNFSTHGDLYCGCRGWQYSKLSQFQF